MAGLPGEFQPLATYHAEVSLSRVLDLTDPGVLTQLKIQRRHLLLSWRTAKHPVLTQRLGAAVLASGRFGANACGRQQFRCRACGACRVLHPKSRQATPERKTEVLRAVTSERLSLRAARVFGVGRNTITGWLEKKPTACRL